ncbi:hypothetical protein ACF0H5_002176 [Mactra antiquata]
MDFVKSTFVLVLFLSIQTVSEASDCSDYDIVKSLCNSADNIVTGVATWVYVLIAIASLIGVAIIVSIIVCCVCCARSGPRPVHGQVIQPQTGQLFYTAAAAQQPVTANGMQYNPNGQNIPMQQQSPGPAYGHNYPMQQPSSGPDDRKDNPRQEQSPGPAYGQNYPMQQSSSGHDDRLEDNPRQQRPSGDNSYPRNHKY